MSSAEYRKRQEILSYRHKLNDLLGVSGTRLHALREGGTDEPAELDAAAVSGAVIGAVIGRFDGHVTVAAGSGSGEPAEGEAHALRLVLRSAAAPKCARCWRHVAPEAEGHGFDGVLLEDGWRLRGHAGCDGHD